MDARLIGLFAAALVCTACAAAPPTAAAATATGRHSPSYQLSLLTSSGRRVLKDKAVDLRELLEATQHREQCPVAHAIDWSQQVGLDGHLGPSSVGFTVTAPSTGANGRVVASAEEEAGSACIAQDSVIEDVWILQHPVTDRQVTAARKAFASCPAKAGLDVPANAGFDAADDEFRTYIAKNPDERSADPTLTAR